MLNGRYINMFMHELTFFKLDFTVLWYKREFSFLSRVYLCLWHSAKEETPEATRVNTASMSETDLANIFIIHW